MGKLRQWKPIRKGSKYPNMVYWAPELCNRIASWALFRLWAIVLHTFRGPGKGPKYRNMEWLGFLRPWTFWGCVVLPSADYPLRPITQIEQRLPQVARTERCLPETPISGPPYAPCHSMKDCTSDTRGKLANRKIQTSPW